MIRKTKSGHMIHEIKPCLKRGRFLDSPRYLYALIQECLEGHQCLPGGEPMTDKSSRNSYCEHLAVKGNTWENCSDGKCCFRGHNGWQDMQQNKE